MTRYAAEPELPPDTTARTAVVLINLGTPEAPTPSALRRYLAEFLADPRVIEIPAILWKPLLHGVILRTRPRASAAKYAAIWDAEGSPLKLYTERLTQALQTLFDGTATRAGQASPLVRYAMRYGQPSIPAVLAELKRQHCERVLLLPLYPQYAASTTATALDAAFGFYAATRNVPELRTVKHFHDHPAYIDALAGRVRDFWQSHGQPDRLLMSFHGLPRYTRERGDPYHDDCHATARLLASALDLAADRWQLSFQSRFGRTQWLQPYTAATLEGFGRAGLARVDVICPGFVADCLETLEEIGIEGKASFLAAGGRELNLIACLNDDARWVRALARIAATHLQGWPDAATHAHIADTIR